MIQICQLKIYTFLEVSHSKILQEKSCNLVMLKMMNLTDCVVVETLGDALELTLVSSPIETSTVISFVSLSNSFILS